MRSLRQVPVQENFINVGGVKLFVRSEGNGKTLLFLHGGPGSSHDYFVPYVAKLARKRNLILYDQRGSGRSDTLPTSEYSIDNYVNEVRRLIRALNLSKVDILGHSWGGFLAQRYALKFQDTIDHLILCCTTSNTITLNSEWKKNWKSIPQKKRQPLESYLKLGGHKRGQPYPGEYVGMVKSLQRGKRKPPVDTTQFTDMIFAGFSWPVYGHLMGGGTFEYNIDGELEGFDTRDELPKITVPTLIMAGKYDGFKLDEVSEMKRLIPNSRMIIFEKSGHWPFLEENSRFTSETERFLSS
ncbi:MAG: proline iminopeptidase-family hydrolase [Nitrososphaerales archaeon]